MRLSPISQSGHRDKTTPLLLFTFSAKWELDLSGLQIGSQFRNEMGHSFFRASLKLLRSANLALEGHWSLKLNRKYAKKPNGGAKSTYQMEKWPRLFGEKSIGHPSVHQQWNGYSLNGHLRRFITLVAFVVSFNRYLPLSGDLFSLPYPLSLPGSCQFGYCNPILLIVFQQCLIEIANSYTLCV